MGTAQSSPNTATGQTPTGRATAQPAGTTGAERRSRRKAARVYRKPNSSHTTGQFESTGRRITATCRSAYTVLFCSRAQVGIGVQKLATQLNCRSEFERTSRFEKATDAQGRQLTATNYVSY